MPLRKKVFVMPHITVLQKEISELIAAGEVIERPASVIKELVENAIDAGASHITVEIKRGGTTYMRIVDDGCGMAPEDVPTAFLRHATSKISTKEDLDRIGTLGFRGEALASIAAVAKVTVLTKRKSDAYGSSYTIAGSSEGTLEQTGCPDGTTLIIRDLFFNVPVRQKFMKRDVTEANAVSQIVQKIALSHPEIAFRMIRDNRTEFRTDGSGDLYGAIYAICGKEFAHDMIPVEYEDGMNHVTGYVGKPLYSRSNRTFQNFFINGRYVRSRACSVALENAYQNLIMVGKFPTCVLMLTVPPSQVDVNIHPAKAEVRFSNEKAVMDSLYFGVKNALMKNGLIYEFQMERVPQKDWTALVEEPQQFTQPTLPELTAPVSAIPEMPAEPEPEVFLPPESTLPAKTAPAESSRQVVAPLATAAAAYTVRMPAESKPEPKPPLELIRREPVSVPAQPAAPDAEESPYQFLSAKAFQRRPEPEQLPPPKAEAPEKVRVIGEIFQNYILAELDDRLLIFDKHAAHERVIFERLKSGASRQTSQMLLRESETLLSMDEFSAVQENLERLEAMGFQFDCSDPPRLRAKAVPSFVLDLNIDEVVTEIAHNLALGKSDPQVHTFQDMLHTIACKSAIRSGDHSTLEELQQLAQEVWGNEAIRHCPHGRPVLFVIRKYDLEKQFRRRV